MNKTVIIPAIGFINWNGGIDYLKFQIKFLIELKKQNQVSRILLLLPVESFLGNFIRIIKNSIKFVLRMRLAKKTVFKYFLFIEDDEINKAVEFFDYYYDKNIGKKSLLYYVKQCNDVIVFPTTKHLKNLSCKQIGYIPDLQHLHFPHFFPKYDKMAKNELFKKILSDCDAVIVNSQDTKQDLQKNYPEESSKAKIFGYPFLPIADISLFNNLVDIAKYNLPEKYFIISSQFWIHKDHLTAFKALKILHVKGYSKIHIVCTGSTNDHRFPNYFCDLKKSIKQLNLEEHIHFLGFIPKNEQIAIMKEAIASIQPTLFEGGPGGGATYDAVSYGIRAIISDIKINTEIVDESVHFFEKQNPHSLSEMMESAINTFYESPTIDMLLARRERNVQSGTNFLSNMFDDVVNT